MKKFICTAMLLAPLTAGAQAIDLTALDPDKQHAVTALLNQAEDMYIRGFSETASCVTPANTMMGVAAAADYVRVEKIKWNTFLKDNGWNSRVISSYDIGAAFGVICMRWLRGPVNPASPAFRGAIDPKPKPQPAAPIPEGNPTKYGKFTITKKQALDYRYKTTDSKEYVKAMLMALNDYCMGSSGDDPNTEKLCAQRDSLDTVVSKLK